MEHRNRLHLLNRGIAAICLRERSRSGLGPGAAVSRFLAFAFVLAIASVAHARVLMTQQQALATAFPAGTKVTRQAAFLTPEQLDQAKQKSGIDFRDQMIVRYAGVAGGRTVGYAYFDTHRVRTLPETIMVVVTPEGRVSKIEILSFDEPPDYLPNPRWIAQFDGRPLDDDLSFSGAIRPMTGATLTARAILEASRKILALHGVIGAR